MYLNDAFQREDQILAALSFRLFSREVGIIRINPKDFARAGVGFEVQGARDEASSAIAVVHIGHRHAPVGHCAVRVESSGLPERALRFEIPKSMELPQALVKERLGSWLRG